MHLSSFSQVHGRGHSWWAFSSDQHHQTGKKNLPDHTAGDGEYHS
jgi:hypothetical protein